MVINLSSWQVLKATEKSTEKTLIYPLTVLLSVAKKFQSIAEQIVSPFRKN